MWNSCSWLVRVFCQPELGLRNTGVINHSLYSPSGRNQSLAVFPTGPPELSPILGRTWSVALVLISWLRWQTSKCFRPDATLLGLEQPSYLYISHTIHLKMNTICSFYYTNTTSHIIKRLNIILLNLLRSWITCFRRLSFVLIRAFPRLNALITPMRE